MNLSTFIVLAVCIAIGVLCIRYQINSGGECSDCGSASYCTAAQRKNCKWTKDLKKAERDLERERKRKARLS